ncbi:uncharacterized protein LOC143469036 [Clavelina lepadiformis]|uniref:uncharacterized protein LOC143469036 n=1 Tax=Clavelina lepadiformis TaxID=159417 RepID=UPI004041C43B
MFRSFLVNIGAVLIFLGPNECLRAGEGPGFQDYYNEAGTLVQRSGSPQVAASLLDRTRNSKKMFTAVDPNSTTEKSTLVSINETTTQSSFQPTMNVTRPKTITYPTNITDPKSTNDPQTTTRGPDGGLSTGEIVGIAVGATVGALIIIGAIVYVVKMNKKKKDNKVSRIKSDIDLEEKKNGNEGKMDHDEKLPPKLSGW